MTVAILAFLFVLLGGTALILAIVPDPNRLVYPKNTLQVLLNAEHHLTLARDERYRHDMATTRLKDRLTWDIKFRKILGEHRGN